MSNSSGYATKAAIKLAQAWDNAWASAVDTLLPFVSETLTRSFDELRSEALVGQAAAHPFAHGTEVVTGDLVLELTYGVATELLGYGFGAQTAGAITFANDLSTKTFNLEIEKVEARYRFYACMVNSITISGSADSARPVSVTLGLIAQKGDKVATAFPTLSLPSDGTEDRVYFEHLRVSGGGALFADQANAIAAGDEIPISSFELAVENNLQADAKDSASGYVVQPMRDGFRTVSVKVGLARYTSTTDNFVTWKNADTDLQAKFTLGNGTETVVLEIPYCKVSDGANFNVGGPGVLTDEVTLAAFYNGSGGSAVNAYMSVTDQAKLTFSAV